MGVIARKKSGSNIPPLAAGVYMATCCGVVDLGDQPNRFKKGSYQDKVLLIFEVADEFVDVDGEQKPRWISKEFTASLSDKAKLKEYLVSWLGDGIDDEEFDLTEMISDACQIQVLVKTTKDGQRQYNDIGGIMGLPRGMTLPPLISDKVIFDMRHPEESKEVLPSLPEWMQDRIKQSPTWARLTANSEEVDTTPQGKPEPDHTAARRPSF